MIKSERIFFNNKLKSISIIYILLICLLVLAADNGALPLMLGRLREIPFGDQIGHFFLIGVLSLTFNILTNFKRVTLRNFTPFLGCLIVFILFTIEESSQIFLRYRSFSILDMIANYLGILVFGHLAGRYISKKFQLKQTAELPSD